MLAGLLPLLFAALLYSILLRMGRGWRDGLLVMSIFWGVAVTAIAEALSAGEMFARTPLALAWLLMSVVAVGVLAIRRPQRSMRVDRSDWVALPPAARIGVVGVAVIGSVLALTAVLAAPNTYDVLTYHMSRVMHWLQNHTIAHYPTSILRQLYNSPWTEFAIAQFVGLTDSNRLANLVQWYAWMGAAIAVSLITRRLGGGLGAQSVAAVFWATLPMGILQATSSKNDLVVSLWILCFIYFGLELASRPPDQRSFVDAGLCGAALGLAALTKGTAFIFGAALVAYVAAINYPRRRAFLREAAVIAACAAALNAGHFARNIALWGRPLGDVTADQPIDNETVTPRVVVSNVLRNAALHMGVPSDRGTAAVERGVRDVDALLRIDPDDPASTFPGWRFQVPRTSRGDENAGNPLHFVLVLAAAAVVVIRWRDAKMSRARWYSIAAAAAVVAFCALLRWQPWGSRLHTPWFGIVAPIVGIAVALPGRARLESVITTTLLVAAVPWTLDNWSRRLVPLEQWWRPQLSASQLIGGDRVAQLFHRSSVPDEYRDVATNVRASRCDDVGLLAHGDDPEYRLWVLLQNGGHRPRIEHVGVKNASAALRRRPFLPCAVVCFRCMEASVRVEGHSFVRTTGGQELQLFLPVTPGRDVRR